MGVFKWSVIALSIDVYFFVWTRNAIWDERVGGPQLIIYRRGKTTTKPPSLAIHQRHDQPPPAREYTITTTGGAASPPPRTCDHLHHPPSLVPIAIHHHLPHHGRGTGDVDDCVLWYRRLSVYIPLQILESTVDLWVHFCLGCTLWWRKKVYSFRFYFVWVVVSSTCCLQASLGFRKHFFDLWVYFCFVSTSWCKKTISMLYMLSASWGPGKRVRLIYELTSVSVLLRDERR